MENGDRAAVRPRTAILIDLSAEYPISTVVSTLRDLNVAIATCDHPSSIREPVKVGHNVDAVDPFLWIVLGDSSSALTRQTSELVQLGVAHLVVLRTMYGGTIGPAYLGRGTACFRCYGARLTSHGHEVDVDEPRPGRSVLDLLWESTLAREVMALVAANEVPGLAALSVNHVLECDGLMNNVARRRVLRNPNCANCQAIGLPLIASWQPSGTATP